MRGAVTAAVIGFDFDLFQGKHRVILISFNSLGSITLLNCIKIASIIIEVRLNVYINTCAPVHVHAHLRKHIHIHARALTRIFIYTHLYTHLYI